MTKKHEKRVSKAIRETDSRKKCLLLVNSIADASLRGTPLLTRNQASDIEGSIRATAGFDSNGNYGPSDEQRTCVAMLDSLHLLALCLCDVQAESLDAKAELASLGGFSSWCMSIRISASFSTNSVGREADRTMRDCKNGRFLSVSSFRTLTTCH